MVNKSFNYYLSYLSLAGLIAGFNCTARITTEKENAQVKADVTLTITSTGTTSQSTIDDFILKQSKQLCILSQDLLDVADRNALQACVDPVKDGELCERSSLKFLEAKQLYKEICNFYQLNKPNN